MGAAMLLIELEHEAGSFAELPLDSETGPEGGRVVGSDHTWSDDVRVSTVTS